MWSCRLVIALLARAAARAAAASSCAAPRRCLSTRCTSRRRRPRISPTSCAARSATAARRASPTTRPKRTRRCRCCRSCARRRSFRSPRAGACASCSCATACSTWSSTATRRRSRRPARSCCGATTRSTTRSSSRRNRRKRCSTATCRPTPCSSSCGACRPRRKRQGCAERGVDATVAASCAIITEQLQQHLARGIKPLYTVFGDETLLALEASDRIRAAARAQGYTEREVLIVDSSFHWNELAFAGSSQSLFAARKLLELRIPNGKPGTEGSAALQDYCERLPADTVTLVQLPGIDWRAQKSSWFEALESAGVAVEARVVTRKALPQWLAGRLKAQKQEADAETLAFIADRVEGNLMAAYQEVQKLALLFPPGKIGFDAGARGGARRRALRRLRPRRSDARRRSAAACAHDRRPAKAKAPRRRSCCGRSPTRSARSGRSSRARPPASRCRRSCAKRGYAARRTRTSCRRATSATRRRR